MRMRKKKWAVPELEASPLYIKAPASLKEQWQQAFVRPQPLYLELGCGKGGFASQFALANPEKNLLAVDISSNMLGVGRRKIDALFSQAGKIPDNVRLVAYDIERIDEILSGQDTVERIFINFCNPWPRPRHFKKRLTHPRQLEKYKTFLRPGGRSGLKRMMICCSAIPASIFSIAALRFAGKAGIWRTAIFWGISAQSMRICLKRREFRSKR